MCLQLAAAKNDEAADVDHKGKSDTAEDAAYALTGKHGEAFKG